jgi:hypothetical protein
MVFCVLLSFFAFAVGPVIGYSMESIQHVGLMIALWAPEAFEEREAWAPEKTVARRLIYFAPCKYTLRLATSSVE